MKWSWENESVETHVDWIAILAFVGPPLAFVAGALIF